jgi:hypothetical protein
MQRIACGLALSLTLSLVAATGAQAAATATTKGPSRVTQSAASLNGSVFSALSPVDYRFQYGPTTSFGFATPVRTAGGFVRYSVSEGIGGLSPGTTYYYRVVAADSGLLGLLASTANGSTKKFKTSGSASSGSGSGGGVSTGNSSKPSDELGGDDEQGDDNSGSGSGPGSAPGAGNDGSGTSTPTTTAPRLEQSVAVSRNSGAVAVRRPGDTGFKQLASGSVIPTGSVVDTRHGSIALTSAMPHGKRQTGRFRGGVFKVDQGRNGLVDLYLRGPVCSASSATPGRASAAVASRRPRRLYGRDHGGRFRTHGRNSQATVRGTRWMVEDRCNGTLTRVTQGAVSVRDFTKHKTVLVKAGEQYLARPRH